MRESVPQHSSLHISGTPKASKAVRSLFLGPKPARLCAERKSAGLAEFGNRGEEGPSRSARGKLIFPTQETLQSCRITTLLLPKRPRSRLPRSQGNILASLRPMKWAVTQ
jgi:hypothetical protein